MGIPGLDTYGLFINQRNHVAFAEIIALIGFYSWVSFAYSSLVQRKLWNPKLAGFARHYIMTEVLDNVLHIMALILIALKDPFLICLIYELCHILCSVLQCGVRWALLGFLLKTTKMYSKTRMIVFTLAPYIARGLCVIAMGVSYAYGVNGVMVPLFLTAEFISLTYDIIVVDTVYALTTSGETVASMSTATMKQRFLTNLLTLHHILLFSMLCAGFVITLVGEFLTKYFWLQPLGAVLAATMYYTYRAYLTSHIEVWLASTSATGRVDLPSSNRSGSRHSPIQTRSAQHGSTINGGSQLHVGGGLSSAGNSPTKIGSMNNLSPNNNSNNAKRNF